MEDEEISIGLISWVEQRLRRSLIGASRKAEIQERLIYSQDINEIKTLSKEVEENQPIMGLEIIPQGQGEELRQAIKYRADRDDYYDRNHERN